MQATFVIVILDVLLALFILLGFLWGVGRGVKKSALRIIFFLLFVGIAALISGAVTSAVMNIQFMIDGTKTGLSEFILTKILENPDLKAMYDSSTSLQTLISQLPAVVLNVVVFWLLMLLSKFVSWIFYAITAKIIFRKKKPLGKFGEHVYTVKENQPVVLTEVKETKHRFWGGVISACQALVFLFLLMLPFSGVAAIVNNLANQTEETTAQTPITLSADNETANVIPFSNTTNAGNLGPAHTATSNQIHQLLGENILQYFEAYEKGIPTMIFSIGGFDVACFDSLTKIDVNGEKIGLRNEIDSIANVYNNVSYFMDLDFNAADFDFKTLNFDKLERAINALFESGIFRSAGVDILNYLIDDAINSGKLDNQTNAAELKKLLQIVENSWSDKNAAATLKSDLLAGVSVLRVLCTSGLVDLANNPSIDDKTAEIMQLIKQNNGKLVTDALEALFQSSTLKNVLVGALNISLENLEITLLEFVNKNLPLNSTPIQSITLDRIKNSALNWDNLKSDLKDILLAISEIYDLNKNYNQSTSTENMNIEDILTQGGVLLHTMSNAQFLSATINGNNIYHQILNQINQTSYKEYVDFNSIKNISWKTEAQILSAFYNSMQPVISYFENSSATSTTFSFKNFDYALLNASFNNFFDSQLVKLLKIDVLKLIVNEDETSGSAPGTNSPLTKIINYFRSNYDFIFETKPEFNELLKAFKIIGESGTVDMLLENNGTYMNDVITALSQTKPGQTKSEIEIAIGHIFAADSIKLMFVETINSWLNSIQTTELQFGKIDKDLTWNGWTVFKGEMEDISNKLLKALGNVNESDRENILQDATVFINQKFEETALYLGGVLDILATSNFFKYTENNVALSIYDTLIKKIFGDVLTLDEALSANYTANFWKTELSNLAPALIKASELTIGEGASKKTVLKAIFEGNDIKQVLEQSGISDADVNLILTALLNSKLFKGQITEVVNVINKELAQLVNPEFADEIAGLTEALADPVQQQDVVNVVNAALKLTELTNIENVDLAKQGEALTSLLDTMQNNSNHEGIFKDTYTMLSDYISQPPQPTDTAEIAAIKQVINNSETNVGSTSADYNWAEIIRLANLALNPAA